MWCFNLFQQQLCVYHFDAAPVHVNPVRARAHGIIGLHTDVRDQPLSQWSSLVHVYARFCSYPATQRVVRAGPALFYLAGELGKCGECDAQRGIEARLRFIAGMRPVRVRSIYVPHFAVENENNWSR